MGKTALALSIIYNIVKERHLPCLFVSLDMTIEQLTIRLDQMDAETDDKLIGSMFLPNPTIEHLMPNLM